MISYTGTGINIYHIIRDYSIIHEIIYDFIRKTYENTSKNIQKHTKIVKIYENLTKKSQRSVGIILNLKKSHILYNNVIESRLVLHIMWVNQLRNE